MADVQQCTGEAHSNPYIDNCMVCAPNWGKYFCCPSCTGRLDVSKPGYYGTCRNSDCVAGGERFKIPR